MSENKPLAEQPKGFTYKYKRLYDLGSDRMGLVDAMLTDGKSTMSVAEHIQFEWNACTSVKIATLDKQIQRYRKDILDPKLVLAANRAAESGTTMTKQLGKFADTVDVIDTLNETITIQYARVNKMYAKEVAKGEKGAIDYNINKELKTLTEMLRTLAHLQLETGIVRRVPKQVQGFFQQLKDEELQEFRLEMTKNDETLKALGVIKDVLQEAVLEEIEDGEYISIEPSIESVSSDDAETVEES